MIMSEELELGESNLCTTVDAFEHFQAITMYEENEYISLSDILPAQQHANHGRRQEWTNQKPLDSGSMLSRTDNDQYVNTSGLGSDEVVTEEKSLKATESNINATKYNEKLKSIVNESLETEQSRDKQSESIQDIENFIKNTEVSTSVKKGGKTKNSENETGKISVKLTKPSKISPCSTVKLSLTNTKYADSVSCEAKNNNKKRGRPRKQTPKQKGFNDSKYTNDIDNVVSSEVNFIQPNILNESTIDKKYTTITRKQVKSKKILMEDDICKSAEIAKPVSDTINLEIKEPKIFSESVRKKTASKRRRQRKNSPEANNKQPENQLSVDDIDSFVFDTDDDESLSNLNKKSNNTLIIDSSSEHKSDITALSTSIENKTHNIGTVNKLNEELSENDSKVSSTTSGSEAKGPKNNSSNNVIQVEDDGDDICLSKLKKIKETLSENDDNGNLQTSHKRNSKRAVMSDFEYNIDSIVNDKICQDELQSSDKISQLAEEGSKRSVRRKTKQPLHYDEGSDEDPFANVELSDDETFKSKKSRYYSDDEYVPGKKKGNNACTESSDTETNVTDDETKKYKRKKISKKLDSSSPKKRAKKSYNAKSVETSIQQIDDIEDCLTPSLIKTNDECDPQSNKWGSTNEFENFLAKRIQGTNLKIKKVSSKENAESIITPLQIPTINPNEPKKTVEMSSQTNSVATSVAAIQTSTRYDIPIKENVPLTSEQSKKACEFLKSIVKTTAELGQLMTQKSNDFIKKKINIENVTDTFKTDYCVKKTFLLFKLAKHNLMQMEEDLSQQYELFLHENKLTHCREEPVQLLPTVIDSDSDCEIVEEPVTPIKSYKTAETLQKFNPKTVFLNKELSIKIAKKPNEEKKLNIKGRNTVWINDSVMVKKVKPTQSFLAQDSRNKKPPDHKYVTLEMVSDFFDKYNYQKMLTICAQFTSQDWLTLNNDCICNYFVIKPDINHCDNQNVTVVEEFAVHTTEHNDVISDVNLVNAVKSAIAVTRISNPKTLLALCIQILQNHICIQRSDGITSNNDPGTCQLADRKLTRKPETLIQLSLKTLYSTYLYEDEEESLKKVAFNVCTPVTIPLLTQLCYKRIKTLLFHTDISPEPQYQYNFDNNFQYKTEIKKINEDDNIPENLSVIPSNVQNGVTEIKSLFTLCVNFLQKILSCEDHMLSSIGSKSKKCRKLLPKSLQHIAFKSIVHLLNIDNYQLYDKQEVCNYDQDITVFTNIPEDNTVSEFCNINSINALTEEAFLNLNTVSLDNQDNPDDLENYEDDNSIFSNHEFETNIHDSEYNLLEGTSWVSQVQMKEFKSGITLTTKNTENSQESEEIEREAAIQVKLEQIEEISSNIVDLSIIKTEYMPGLDEMTIIPENVVPKSEPECSVANDDCILTCNSSSYDATVFEEFLSSNKLITSQSIYENGEVFSQSILRVSGFHEPDFDSELDSFDSLLIPQTYKALHVENAKNCLMESNSDDDNANTKTGRKKIDKRKTKRKALKVLNKNALPLIKEPEKSQSNNDLTTMTTRMRDKIRQKEKELASSESEGEGGLNMNLKQIEDNKKFKTKSTVDANNSEIQCNDVDSTQKNTEKSRIAPNNDEIFKGSNESEQTEISGNLQYLTDKVLSNKVTKETASERTEEYIVNTPKESHSSVINYDSPVELLECEPIMPIFDDFFSNKSDEKSTTFIDPKQKPFTKDVQDSVNENNENTEFIDRHGWKCYKIDCNDSKLVQNVKIILEKLPETFVTTYIQYQDIMDRHVEDLEIDRLTNLNSLKKSIRDNNKPINTIKRKVITEQEILQSVPSETNNEEVNGDESEYFDELTPSEDEDTDKDDQPLSLLPLKTPENNIAKDSLMNDNDSDDGTNIDKIKEEPSEHVVQPKGRPGPKSKKNLTVKDNSELMLTADKVMNKELLLLNGPVSFNNDVYIPNKDSVTKKKQKTLPTRTYLTRERVKIEKEEEDYSSEEEKRWFNTKEKLLKNTDKRENASVSDAKHAKLVSEFIEKREGDKTRKRKIFKCRRSRKKMLEQQKQLSVLYKELYGETLESVTGAQSFGKGYAKGQRNNGKMSGKKCQKSKNELAYPILFEESERTKRLYARQAQLRELLGCEENETVQVIEDKVCLEYDFETRKPVVSVHPFFTEVMKEHQYAGVKFMWDACFESLADIERGHLGSGCILAHCMGLGKTLQVLALLHTVMTHPRVGMRRVLVCCPLSTVLNWVDEIHKWIGPVTNEIKVFELSKLKKTYQRAYQLEDWFKGGGIFIIGYELFRSLTTLDPLLDNVRPNVIHKIRSALLDPGPDIIVCDEGHLLKNDYSILTMAMSRVTTKRRIVLTGTPMQNNLREYYCMVNFIKPNLLGTYTEFYKRFENPIINGQHRDSTEEDTKLMNSCTYILHKVLEGCLQRHEVSVMYPYLPKKHEYTVFTTLTKYQWNMYKHYMYSYAKEAKQNVLKDFHILQKIWSHPQVLHNFQTKSLMNKSRIKVEKFEDDLAQEDLAADMKPTLGESWWLQYLEGGEMLDCIESSNKFLAVFRILEECVAIGNKVLIFSTSLFTLDSLEYFLKKINNWSLGQEYFRLDGSVPAEVRQKWCREFNAENNHNTKLFLISTRAGCLGLNLTAANRVIILDTSWNPAHDIQSIFRVYRFGQKRDCFIYRLVAMGTMEQKIYERSVTKQAVACRVLDEQLIDRHYNSADLNELYLYDETGMNVPGGVSVGVADAVILRVARDAPIHAVHEHDSLLRGSSEQGLPEHERTAAWNKFQQEHAQKQMINKIGKGQKQSKHSKESETMTADSIVEAIQKEYVNNEAKLGLKAPTPIVNRGRKTVVTNCCIPIKKDDEPGPSNQPAVTIIDNAVEDIMVKKISTILMKHNYYNEEETKIVELVNKVRNIIARGSDCVVESGNDELSNSIADILLQKEMSVPILTDIMSESINNTTKTTPSDEENKGRKRKNETNDEESAIISDVLNKSDNGKRKKRKAALAAKQSLEFNLREYSNLYLGSHETDDFKRRSKRLESQSENTFKSSSKTEDARNDRDNNTKKSIVIVENDSNTQEKQINESQTCLENGNNKKRKSLLNDAQLLCDLQKNNLKQNDHSNILNEDRRKLRKVLPERSHDPELEKQLIDLTEELDNEHDKRKKRKITPIMESQTDDIIDLTEKTDSAFKTVAKKAKSINPKNHKLKDHQKHNNKDNSTSDSNNTKYQKETNKVLDKEVVPLHPSILKNENFIKIVAHKYLKDNPMMTQEVAILAARHNINAALAICESGKTICSGDIYDKAVEILGIEMLKDLHKMGVGEEAKKVKKPTLNVHVRAAESPKNAISKPQDTNDSKKTTVVNLQNQDTSESSFKVFQMRSKVGTNPVPTVVPPQQLNCDVVPVGLFKGPANIQATENFQQDVDGSFHIVDEDECILPDDEKAAPTPPLKIVPQRHPDSAPSILSTVLRTQTVTASDSIITPTKPVITVPFKVTSGPKSSTRKTQHAKGTTTRTLTHSARKTLTPIATQPPLTAKKPASNDKDVVVILSDDEEPPAMAPPTIRPSDDGPVPVALTAAGDTHSSPPKLTVIRGHNSRSKTQCSPKLSLMVLKNNETETTLNIEDEVQQVPVSTILNSGSSSSPISSSSKAPLILRKLVPINRAQLRKGVGLDKVDQEKRNLQNNTAPESSTTQNSSVNTSNSKLHNFVESKHQSIFNNVVHIQAPECLQNTAETETVPQLKQKLLTKTIHIVRKSNDTPSTSNIAAVTTKQDGRVVKLLKPCEPPSKLQINNTTKNSVPPIKLQIPNSTKKYESPSKLQIINSTKKSEHPSKLQIINSTKKSENPSKLQITKNAIIDLTDESWTSDQNAHNSINKVSINKSYTVSKNSKSICEKYDTFKNIILKRNDGVKPIVTKKS